ncbi:MAG TPA: hypothetical protein IAA11_06620 [Candidatus Blautia intestinigallinarum]|nr:hypothetical protein [Candidatus Blautia intestinigallinarum]
MEMIKKILKIAALIILLLVLIVAIFFGLLIYVLRYKIETKDQSESLDGAYTLFLQSVGTPFFFGPSNGRLLLEEDGKKVSLYRFTLYDDGKVIRPESWQVSWEEEYVEVQLFGEEQYDVQVRLFYDGKSESESLSTQEGEAVGNSGESKGASTEENLQSPGNQKDETDIFSKNQSEIHMRQLRIEEGFQAVYDAVFAGRGDTYTKSSDAKGNLRIILEEDKTQIRYLAYDRESENGQCGLYVAYLCEKAADGSWSPMEAKMLDTYAYVYDTGKVIASGKTSWEEGGSWEYQEATGEF